MVGMVRVVRFGAVIAGVVVSVGLVAGAGAARAATPPAAAISWGPAREVPGTAALNTAGGAKVSQVACAAQHDCVAIGYYTRVDPQHPASPGIGGSFAADAANGTWARAQDLASGQYYVSAGPLSCAPGG